MTHIIFDEQRIELEEGQTVLSALLERDHDIANSCRVGVCQSCLLQAVDGEVPESAQVGLKDTLKVQGYFLACSCKPETPLHVVKANDTDLYHSATVIEHELLGSDILRLRLKPEHMFEYRAGQFVTLWKTQSLGRSYSLASVAELDDSLELHIRRIPGGQLSNWLHDEVKVGNSLQLQSATGNCFYIPGSAEQKILLAGTGTGLAPLIGIARDALRQRHSGEIHLIHGTVQKEDLYLHQTLLDMAKQNEQFHYYANVLRLNEQQVPDNANSIIRSLPLEQQVTEIAVQPAEWKAYLCGDESIVNSLKKKLFISGFNMKNIYTDPFVISTDV